MGVMAAVVGGGDQVRADATADPAVWPHLPAAVVHHGRRRHHRQHDRTQADVEAVEAGQQEEGRSVDARSQRQAELRVGVVVFVSLEADEGEAQDQRDREPQVQCAALVRLQRGAVATSSQLKRRFGSGLDSTHHLIDPATHSSAQSEAHTVTVIAASGARAEVLTKRGFVDSPEEFLTWLPSVGGAGLIIFADGSQQASANWSIYA